MHTITVVVVAARVNKFIYGLLIMSLCNFSYGQSNVSLKYFGLSIHPFGDNQAQLEPYKLDKKAHLVLNFGGILGYEKYIWEDFLSVKAAQGVFTDCSNGLMGLSFIGLKGVMIDRGKHRLSFALGPVYLYRKDWNRFTDYKDTGFFKRHESKIFGHLQTKFFWYGAEIEYDLRMSSRLDLSVTFTPGFPMILAYAIGIKYWINKNPREKEKLVVF